MRIGVKINGRDWPGAVPLEQRAQHMGLPLRKVGLPHTLNSSTLRILIVHFLSRYYIKYTFSTLRVSKVYKVYF